MAEKQKKSSLSAEMLRAVIRYSPDSGEFIWLTPPGKRLKPGDIACSRNGAGYIQIGLCGFRYYGHRLAYLYMMGSWPPVEIDHINGDRSDNRWANLRSVDRASNAKNVRRHKDNKSGVKGVSWSAERHLWVAQICIRGCQTHLGRFGLKQDAETAYRKAADIHFGEFARLG